MKKLMVITSRFPFPLDKGDKLRAYHQIKELAKNCEVHLVSLTRKKVSESDENELNKFCKSVHVFKISRVQSFLSLVGALFGKKPFQVALFYDKKAHKKISKVIKEVSPNHIYCQLIRVAEYVKNEFHIPKTIDFMDVLSKGIERRIATSPFYLKKILAVEAERLKIYENIMFEYFDNRAIISKQDQELIYHLKRKEIKIIPNGIDTDYFSPDPNRTEKKYTLLFNGNMQYHPNVKSAIYIVKHILPLVKEQIPEVNLLISGTSPTKEIKDLATDNVTVSGWMDDIRDAYNTAFIFVAPMQIGTGLQNKLLEAMAMEMPCVTSKLANNALNAEPNSEILIGNNKEEYAEQIISLIRNKEKAMQIAKKGQAYVRTNFNWEISTQKLFDSMYFID